MAQISGGAVHYLHPINQDHPWMRWRGMGMVIILLDKMHSLGSIDHLK